MKNHGSIMLLAGLVVAALLVCSRGSQGGPATAPAEKTWENAMKRPFSADFTTVGFKDALHVIQGATGLNIVVRWNRLEESGVDGNSVVGIKLTDAPLGDVIQTILDAVPANNELKYIVNGNILTVSTVNDLDGGSTFARMYDVRGITNNGDPAEMSQIVEVIRGTCPNERVTALGGNLVVSASRQSHSAISELLKDMFSAAEKSANSPTPAAQAKQAEIRVKLVGNMKDTCFDSRAMGIVAVGGLRQEIGKSPQETAKLLAELLESTKSIGLRNAIRLTLKDIYAELKDTARVQEQLKAMLLENDDALQKAAAAGVGR